MKNYLNSIILLVLFLIMAFLLGMLPVATHFRILSHRQKVITIRNSPHGTLVGEKEVIYYHKGR